MNDFLTNRILQILSLFIIINTGLMGQEKITPKMPEINKDLIYNEGEDAIVTNFSTSATLNYSASGQKTLQLNTYKSNYQSSPYFSEYSVYVEESGTYSFWYSGTPPGTKEDVYPSYSSPFSLIIDGVSVTKYREDVNVVETYAPGLYWIKAETFDLEAGYHNIRFEITDKRGFDGKYYFYLDSFFLFKGDETDPGQVPDIFPNNMDERSIDSAFREISYYQINIKNDPAKVDNYMSLANIYILIGDYLNAIKMLTRVVQIDPENKDGRLLLAKTNIWNGNTDKGISLYETYLNLFPESLSVWEEAGKIAAWVGKYDKSIDIFNRGLSIFPDSISLNINLALTYLWNSMIIEGLEVLDEQENRANKDLNQITSLAEVYSVNGYPDYAINFYKKSLKDNPDFIELYLNLEKLYRNIGNDTAAEEVVKDINNKFYISDQLKNIMETNVKKTNIKNQYITNLESEIDLDPMNMELRELLVQTLFWNGIVNQAIQEYKAIITIKNFNEMNTFESESIPLYRDYDLLQYMINYFKDNLQLLSESKQSYYNGLIKYRTALINDVDVEIQRKALSSTVNNINTLLSKNEYLYDQFSSLKESILENILSENEKEEIFQNIISGNNWKLDSKYLLSELKEVSENKTNKPYSNFILGRYYLIEGDYKKSEIVIGSLDEYSPNNKLLNYHNSLWSGKKIDQDLFNNVISYFDGLNQEQSLLSGLDSVIGESTEITSEDLDRTNILIDKIEAEQAKVVNFKILLNDYEKKQKLLLHNKLIRSIYKHQENTHLLRYAIGDYYLQDKQYSKALTQFNQVIAIDPFNISASFNLGRLQQLTGDWNKALNSYENVFTVDPAYENAAIMHNQLSILHPEITKGEFKFFIDTSRLKYNIDFSTDFYLSSWIKVSPYWNGSTFSYFTWDDIGTPRTYRLDDFILNSEFNFFEGNTKLKPSIGFSVSNNKFDYISPIEEIDYESILSSGEFSPNLSLTINQNIENISLSAGISLKQLPESIPSDIKDITTVTQDYSISGYYPIVGKKSLTSLSFRTFFSIDSRTGYEHDNQIVTFVQDFYSTFILLKAPWTTQVIYSATSFENSLDDDSSIYYTPDKVLISKLGGTTSSYIGINGGVLSLSGRLAPGVYVEKVFDDPEVSFTADSDVQIAYKKNNKSLYTKLYGSGSYSDSLSPDYWSLQFSLGFNIYLYKLLAP